MAEARPLSADSRSEKGQHVAASMAEEEEVAVPARGVKDVPAEAFITAYAAHLKTNDKVREAPRPLPDAIRLAPCYLRPPAPPAASAIDDGRNKPDDAGQPRRATCCAAKNRKCCLYPDAPCFHSLCRRRRNVLKCYTGPPARHPPPVPQHQECTKKPRPCQSTLQGQIHPR